MLQAALMKMPCTTARTYKNTFDLLTKTETRKSRAVGHVVGEVHARRGGRADETTKNAFTSCMEAASLPSSHVATPQQERRRGLTPILPTCKIIKLQSENARRDDNPHFAKSATILNKRCSPLILPLPLKIVCTHTVERSDMVKKSARRGGRGHSRSYCPP